MYSQFQHLHCLSYLESCLHTSQQIVPGIWSTIVSKTQLLWHSTSEPNWMICSSAEMSVTSLIQHSSHIISHFSNNDIVKVFISHYLHVVVIMFSCHLHEITTPVIHLTVDQRTSILL